MKRNISVEICAANLLTIALRLSGELNFTGRFYVAGKWL
jgi:hypothetical protein